jgi:NAD(P)-dependent dehydrogenase (short-subunit alcohol dehydrogenase family)
MNTAIHPDLRGKIVLVTGSSKALGAETARHFAAAGSRVAVNGRDQQALATSSLCDHAAGVRRASGFVLVAKHLVTAANR